MAKFINFLLSSDLSKSFWVSVPGGFWRLNPLLVKNNSVDSRSAAPSHVGHNSSAHVARGGRLLTDAAICNFEYIEISQDIREILKLCASKFMEILKKHGMKISMFRKYTRLKIARVLNKPNRIGHSNREHATSSNRGRLERFI